MYAFSTEKVLVWTGHVEVYFIMFFKKLIWASEEFVVVIEGTFRKTELRKVFVLRPQLLKINLFNFSPAQGCVACERRRISGRR